MAPKQRSECPHSKKARDYLTKFLKMAREKRTIEFTDLGVPTGENRCVFQTLMSYAARTILGCHVHDWRTLTEEQRKELWAFVKVKTN